MTKPDVFTLPQPETCFTPSCQITNGWNRPATINYPGGVSLHLTYDDLMRLETLTATAPDSTPILTYGYP
jgi:hypothetical protein